MNEDLQELIDKALSKEKELQVRSEELALQDKRFADYLQAKKHADDELEVLWGMVHDYMEENGFTEFDSDYISLKLVPLGKFKADNIDDIPDELCKIVRQIDNKKVKAYFEINGCLPDGVSSLGNRLIKKVKDA